MNETSILIKRLSPIARKRTDGVMIQFGEGSPVVGEVERSTKAPANLSISTMGKRNKPCDAAAALEKTTAWEEVTACSL